MRRLDSRSCWPQIYYGTLLFIASLLYLLFNSWYRVPSSISVVKNPTSGTSTTTTSYVSPSTQYCNAANGLLPADEKYMLYTPHSGFSNQVGELKNALLIAALLNRTLVLPPIFDHHAVALGSCPKFRVHEPHEMRALAWAHISDLIKESRYVALADVIDLSSVASLVKLIDLRIFSLLFCGVDVSSACSSGPVCRGLVASGSTGWGTLEGCGVLLASPQEVHSCVYGVKEDCRTTVWVHGREIATLEASVVVKSSNSGDEKRKNRKRSFKDIVNALGSASDASQYQVLAFGSLFSAEYKGTQLHVNIESSNNPKIRNLLETIKFLPFTPPLVDAGKLYVSTRIKQPFMCAQLRLLDGQFKNHWQKTFASLESQLKLVRVERGASRILHVFVMTDLPQSNWTKTPLGDLDANRSQYMVHTLDGSDPLIWKTAHKLAKEEYGLRSGFLPPLGDESRPHGEETIAVDVHPDILLFVEEVVCSCATLGFVGTSGSTLTANIIQLRTGSLCKANS